jgi:hypothetical protein
VLVAAFFLTGGFFRYFGQPAAQQSARPTAPEPAQPVRTTPTSTHTVPPQNVETSQPVGEARTLVNDKVAVEGQHYKSFQFEVPADHDFDIVEGTFRVVAGKDIEVYILDKNGFENFSNGTASKTYYNSGRVTVDSPSVTLRPGSYYLVLSATFSVFTKKLVEINIQQRQS